MTKNLILCLALVCFFVQAFAVTEPIRVQPVSVSSVPQPLLAPAAGTDQSVQLVNKVNNGSLSNVIHATGTPEGNLNHFASTFERPLNRSLYTEPLPMYHDAGAISFTERMRSPLDLPLCTLITSDDTLSYYTGIVAGDAYKIWIDPADCACGTTYPYRIDSVCIQLVQDDGSPADTVLIGVDIECAFGGLNDPCEGPGFERCGAIYSVALPAETQNDTLSVYTVYLPLDTCRVDGPFFVGLFHFGHTLADTFFHPVIAFADDTPQAAACEVYTNLLGGGWSSWADTWLDPDPGVPEIAVFGECDNSGPGEVVPCPVECAHQRINPDRTLAYYNTGTTGIWQFYDLAEVTLVDYPYHITQIDFSMYYDTTGTTTDTTDFIIWYGCPNNGNICCVPMDVLCAGTISIVRTNTGDNVFLPLILDLTAMECCLTADFFVGIAILRHTGTAASIPKFLFSNRVTEQGIGNDIPSCHQWGFNGAYYSFPSGAQLGWADIVITGECGNCPNEITPSACTANGLNCAGAQQFSCSPNPIVLAGQSTVGGGDNANLYCCQPWDETGPERVYQLNGVPNLGSITATLSNMTVDLDVFILSACDPEMTVACGDETASATNLVAGTYYVVVDGFDEAEGSFDLTINFPCGGGAGCPTTLCGTGLNGGGTVLVWDGELMPDGNTAWLCQGTAVGGNDMVIKIISPSCGLVSTIDIGGASVTEVARGLAYDPRDNSWWTGTFVAPKALRHYNAAGTLLASFDSLFFAGQHNSTYSISGLAMDTDNNHLWATQSNVLAGHYIEFNVNNAAAPAILQTGGMAIFTAGNAHGGLDYIECEDKLVAASFDPSPLGRGDIECWQDVASGIFPPLFIQACVVQAPIPQNWGIALNTNDALVTMANLDAVANTNHTAYTAARPCLAVPPAAPTQTRILRAGADIAVHWHAPSAGRYLIYRTTVKNNDGNPDGGTDPQWGPAIATVVVTIPGAQLYTEVGGWAADAYRNYVVTNACP